MFRISRIALLVAPSCIFLFSKPSVAVASESMLTRNDDRAVAHRAAFETKLNSFVEYYKEQHHQRRKLFDNDFCEEFEGELASEGFNTDCTCSGDGTSSAVLSCDSVTPFCEDGLCADFSFSMSATANANGDLDSLGITFCLDFTDETPEICVTVEIDGAANLSCEVSIDGTTCSLCQYCNNDEGVTLDCTNIQADFFSSSCQVTGGNLVFLPEFVTADSNAGGGSSGGNTATVSGLSFLTVLAFLVM